MAWNVLFRKRADRSFPLLIIFLSGPVLHEVPFLEDLDGVEEVDVVLLYIRFSLLIVPFEFHGCSRILTG